MRLLLIQHHIIDQPCGSDKGCDRHESSLSRLFLWLERFRIGGAACPEELKPQLCHGDRAGPGDRGVSRAQRPSGGEGRAEQLGIAGHQGAGSRGLGGKLRDGSDGDVLFQAEKIGFYGVGP